MNHGILDLRTNRRCELLDITDDINAFLAGLGEINGTCTILIPHTTAAVLLNEGHDPDVATDILDALARLAPVTAKYLHREGNSDAHIKAALLGSSITVPVRDGQLWLGTWQRVFLCEFDGPRHRQVRLTVTS